MILDIVTLIVLGVFLSLFLYKTWKTQGEKTDTLDWSGPVAELERRMESLEVKWVTIRDDLQERLELGQEVWRKTRQRERAQEKRDLMREDEDHQDDDQIELMELPPTPPPDPRGMGFTDPGGESPWQATARALARQIASGGGN